MVYYRKKQSNVDMMSELFVTNQSYFPLLNIKINEYQSMWWSVKIKI